MNTLFEQLTSIIRNRRSVFPAQYIDRPISSDTIDLILENANWAPTHKRTEPWRYHVIQGEALVRLGRYLAERYKSITAIEQYSEAKYKKTLEKATKSTAVIGITYQRDLSESIPEWEEIAATAMAAQNIWLTCETLGIGTYWSSPKTFTENNTFLNMEDGEVCLGLMYMGYYDPRTKTTGIRNPISEKVNWITK